MNTATDQMMSGATAAPLLTRNEEFELFTDVRSGEVAQKELEKVDLKLAKKQGQYIFQLSGDRTSPPTTNEKALTRTTFRGIKARKELVIKNRRLVMDCVKKYRYRSQSDFDDIYQCGTIGLNRAIDKFDLSKGYKFSTYAYNWIRNHASQCADTVSKSIKVPSNVRESLSKIRKIHKVLRDSNDRPPNEIEIIEAFNQNCLGKRRKPLTVQELRLYLSVERRSSSLDCSLKDSNQTVIDLISAPEKRPCINDLEAVDFFKAATIGFEDNEIEALRLNIFEGIPIAKVERMFELKPKTATRLKCRFARRSQLLLAQGFEL